MEYQRYPTEVEDHFGIIYNGLLDEANEAIKKIQVKPDTPESHTGGNITHTPCI